MKMEWREQQHISRTRRDRRNLRCSLQHPAHVAGATHPRKGVRKREYVDCCASLRIGQREPRIAFRERVPQAEVRVSGNGGNCIVGDENAKVRVRLDPNPLHRELGRRCEDRSRHVPAKLLVQACRRERLRHGASLLCVDLTV